jgi:ribosome maturation factor RimP
MTIETLNELIKPALASIDLTLWGIELIGQGGGMIVRVYIDSEKGATISDCEKATKQIGAVLDVEDVFSSRYTLEVSTPGMERGLFEKAHYQRYIGQQAKIKLSLPIEEKRKHIGVITNVTDDEVMLKVGENEITIPFHQIKKANLVC